MRSRAFSAVTGQLTGEIRHADPYADEGPLAGVAVGLLRVPPLGREHMRIGGVGRPARTDTLLRSDVLPHAHDHRPVLPRKANCHLSTPAGSEY
jgi:hypothetical protein